MIVSMEICSFVGREKTLKSQFHPRFHLNSDRARKLDVILIICVYFVVEESNHKCSSFKINSTYLVRFYVTLGHCVLRADGEVHRVNTLQPTINNISNDILTKMGRFQCCSHYLYTTRDTARNTSASCSKKS